MAKRQIQKHLKKALGISIKFIPSNWLTRLQFLSVFFHVLSCVSLTFRRHFQIGPLLSYGVTTRRKPFRSFWPRDGLAWSFFPFFFLRCCKGKKKLIMSSNHRLAALGAGTVEYSCESNRFGISCKKITSFRFLQFLPSFRKFV